MAEVLTILLKITVVIFMAGNLLDLGLRMNLQAALRGLRDVRFVTLSVMWAFVLCPALAYGPHPAGFGTLCALASRDG
jgi:predicted Na+-dependent transporter